MTNGIPLEEAIKEQTFPEVKWTPQCFSFSLFFVHLNCLPHLSPLFQRNWLFIKALQFWNESQDIWPVICGPVQWILREDHNSQGFGHMAKSPKTGLVEEVIASVGEKREIQKCNVAFDFFFF